MLKDPHDDAITPYELLALNPEAPCGEVQKALPRFMKDRRNLPRLGQAQEAVRKLQNPKARGGIDIWFYHLDLPHIDGPGAEFNEPIVNGAGLESRHPDLKEFQQIPVVPAESLYNDLQPEAMRAEFREIPLNPVTFSDIPDFAGIQDLPIQPRFDV